MARHQSTSRSRSPARRKTYDEPRDRRRDRRSPDPSGLLVRNISLSSRPEDLRVPFERFGPVKDVYLPKNYYTGEPRGFGFVKFRYPEDAAEAKIRMDRTVIGGREIRIVFAEENRKTPHEMRRVTRTSSRGSHRRRSRSFSPRRRYHSRSRTPSPTRHDSRDSRGYRGRDDRHSRHRPRSISRSVSPRDERTQRSHERSPRHRSRYSRSVSPLNEKNHKPGLQSPSPRENGLTGYARSRSQSPRRNSRSPARFHYRPLRFFLGLVFVENPYGILISLAVSVFEFLALILMKITNHILSYHKNCFAAGELINLFSFTLLCSPR